MCGLAAILSSEGPTQDRRLVMQNMLNLMMHRGPDGGGIVEIEHLGILGHRRLAIIDLEGGIQPIQTGCGRFSLVYNGELYNYLDIKKNLSALGYEFLSQSDSEVLLYAIVEWGDQVFEKLNGMFSFVFVDRESRGWLAARDHFGIKPLYYSCVGNEIVFASEIKSILAHPNIKALRDEKSLHQYLSFQFCLEERTLFSGIKKVKPGSFIKGVGSQIIASSTYWQSSYEIDEYHTEDYFVDQLQYLLQDSMRLQLQADVPVGGYLSGGLDSSLVCSVASSYRDDPFPMFHGKFAEGPQYDESSFAFAVEKQIGGKVHEVVPTKYDFVDSLPGLIRALDEPLAGPGLFPQYCVSKLAKERGVTVVLGGQGGDELFGGYARYLVGYLEQALKGAILQTSDEGKHLVTLDSIVPNLALLKNYTPLLKNFWSEGLFSDMDHRYFRLVDRSQGLRSLLTPEYSEGLDFDEVFADFQNVFNTPDTKSYINKMTNFDQQTLLPALLQIEDRVSMSVSLESRVPLLDKRIVDVMTSMPPPIKFQAGKTKHILKRCASGYLPEKVLHREDKMGFPVPLAEWMSGGVVRDFVSDMLLSRASLDRGIYSRSALEAMIDSQGVGGRQLWGALSLELWHREFIDDAI